MTERPSSPRCDRAELACAYALRALPADEVPAFEAHLSACAECRREIERLLPIVDSFAAWPTDVLRPAPSLWDRLARRIADETGGPVLAAKPQWRAPEWEQVAPGIECKLLATDKDRSRVSMLVRLAPDTEYPPHSHAGVEELHLLQGELWINERKLYPGEYSYAEAGTSDQRVYSETGCTCVLITSPRDILR
jgi:anti-sigma factor ChrR (cupin superfamily)